MQDNKNKIGKDMTEGNIARLLIELVGPLLLANLIQQLYNSVDMLIVGKIVGNKGTVGVSTGGEIAALVTFVSISLGTAGQILTAQMVGAGKRAKIEALCGTALSFELFLAIVCSIGNVIFFEPLLVWMNCPFEAYEDAANYMRIVALGLPFVFGYNVLCGVMRGMGETKRPLYFICMAAAVNVVLDLLLVSVIPLGVAGSAIATVIAQGVSFFTAFIFMYLRKDKAVFHFSVRGMCWRKMELKELLSLGLPLTVQSTCIHFSQLICVSWVNDFGMIAATVNSIGSKVNRLLGAVTNSITGATGAMVGQNLGGCRYDRVRKAVYIALKLCLVMCVAEIFLVLVFPEWLCRIFIDDKEVITLGVVYLRILIITFVLSAIQGPYTSVISGSGNAKLNFCCGILDGFILRLGISYWLAFVGGYGVIGYWYGNALAHLGPVVIGIVYFYSGKWKDRELNL